MTITQTLSHYAATLDETTVRGADTDTVRTIIRDCFGCIIAGMTDNAIAACVEHAREFGGAGQASVIRPGGMKTDIMHAAMINAMSAHVRDFDDICVSMEGHPTVAVLPVALAVGEYAGASGKDVLLAYAAGVEIAAVLGNTLFACGYSMGWDTTCTQGIFGTTVAAGKLLKLSEEQMTNALGLAATEASGLRASYGTMAKDLTAGRSAAKGVYCALMAKRGYTANPSVFEDGSGLLAVLGTGADTELMEMLIKRDGLCFTEPGMIMKLYPSCRGTHNAIDAAMEIALSPGFNADDISEISCFAQKTAMENDRYPIPGTPMEGKFSIPYCVSLALKNKHVGLADFDGDVITDDAALALARTVSMQEDEGRFSKDAFYGTEVIVTMKDGRVFSKKVDTAKGDPKRPVSEEELYAKFMECAAFGVDAAFAKSLYGELSEFDRIPGISAFLKKLTENMRF